LSAQAEQLQQSIAFFNTGAQLTQKGNAIAHERRGSIYTPIGRSFVPLVTTRPIQEATAPQRLDVSGLDVDKVISAHAQWKTKFRAAISRQETMDAATIARDDCCELGKWLHGSMKVRMGRHPRFMELLSEHKKFHKEAGRVAIAINEKEFSHATQMIEHGSAFAEASTLVTNALSAIKRT